MILILLVGHIFISPSQLDYNCILYMMKCWIHSNFYIMFWSHLRLWNTYRLWNIFLYNTSFITLQVPKCMYWTCYCFHSRLFVTFIVSKQHATCLISWIEGTMSFGQWKPQPMALRMLWEWCKPCNLLAFVKCPKLIAGIYSCHSW